MPKAHALQCVILLLSGASRCLATTPFPGQAECGVLERVAAAAAAQPSMRTAALEVLERITEARMAGAATDLEVKVGLRAGLLHDANFEYYSVRSCAVRDIAKLDLPEALTYLESLKKAQFGPDFGRAIWSSAQVALREAQFNRLPDEPARIRFLEDTTSDKSASGWWAVNELCDRGSYQSLPYIRAHVTSAYSSDRDISEAIGFCEERMNVIARNPNTVKALGSVLAVDSGVTNARLLAWAINQLRAIDSLGANAELERFADEVDDLPDGSPLKSELWGVRVQIRGLAPPRRK